MKQIWLCISVYELKCHFIGWIRQNIWKESDEEFHLFYLYLLSKMVKGKPLRSNGCCTRKLEKMLWKWYWWKILLNDDKLQHLSATTVDTAISCNKCRHVLRITDNSYNGRFISKPGLFFVARFSNKSIWGKLLSRRCKMDSALGLKGRVGDWELENWCSFCEKEFSIASPYSFVHFSWDFQTIMN